MVDGHRAAAWLTPRRKNAHKGDAGRVLIIAGSRGMAGAAVMTALGAVRSGAGLVRVAIVGSQQTVVAKRAPLEVTTASLPEDSEGRISSSAGAALRRIIAVFQPDVIAMGPGLGRSAGVRVVVRNLFCNSAVPLVLDADGLNALSELKFGNKPSAPVILTPHEGEMARLLEKRGDRASRVARVASAAKRFGTVVLLKGAGTLVSDGRSVWKNSTGLPAMATGGMGDILTGIIAATWAQMDRIDRDSGVAAAAFGAYAHGLAAEIASTERPERTLLATDVAAALPAAFKKLWRLRARGGAR